MSWEDELDDLAMDLALFEPRDSHTLRLINDAFQASRPGTYSIVWSATPGYTIDLVFEDDASATFWLLKNS